MFGHKKSDTLPDDDMRRDGDVEPRGEHASTVPPETSAEYRGSDAPMARAHGDDDRREASRFNADAERHTTALSAKQELQLRREEFGGLKGGAVFYGWLVAVALTILLIGIVSAIATAVGSSLDVTTAQAELRAGSIGVGAAITFVVILAIGYLAGGYVAGRMARFNGVRQGTAVWVLGLLITLMVVAVGAIFGDKYDVFDRVNLPSLPVRADDVTAGGLIAIAAALAATLVTAIIGGMLGQRFHTRIDRAAI